MVNAWIGCAPGAWRLGFRQNTKSTRLADLAQANLGTLGNGGDVLDAQGCAGLSLEDCLFDVVDVPVETDFADVDLLLALLDEAAAGVGVVICKLLFDLADAEAIGDKLVGIDADLVFASYTAEAGDINDAGDGFELLLKSPILERFQIHVVV